MHRTKKKQPGWSLLQVLVSVILLLAPAAGHAAGIDKFLALGTSSKVGVYYPVGQAISSLINETGLTHGIRSIAYNTGGSEYNIQALATGELDLAITRSNLVHMAYLGQGDYESIGPNHDFRLITVLYEMPAAVIVRNDLEAADLSQIPGSRINLGNPGSGKRSVADLLFTTMGWGREDFAEITEYSGDKAAEAFCNGDVDVIIESLGIPASYFDQITGECNGRFIPLPAEAIDRILADNPSFRKGVIPGGLYPNNPEDVQTFTVDSVLITSKRVHPQSIYQVAKVIFDDLERFRGMDPALSLLTLDAMITDRPFIPYHDGVLQYFKEKDLIKPHSQ